MNQCVALCVATLQQCGKTLLGKNGGTIYVLESRKKMGVRIYTLSVVKEIFISVSQKGNLGRSGKGHINSQRSGDKQN